MVGVCGGRFLATTRPPGVGGGASLANSMRRGGWNPSPGRACRNMLLPPASAPPYRPSLLLAPRLPGVSGHGRLRMARRVSWHSRLQMARFPTRNPAEAVRTPACPPPAAAHGLVPGAPRPRNHAATRGTCRQQPPCESLRRPRRPTRMAAGGLHGGQLRNGASRLPPPGGSAPSRLPQPARMPSRGVAPPIFWP